MAIIGNVGPRDSGKIAAAGPTTNILISLVSLSAFRALSSFYGYSIVNTFLLTVAYVNAYLALFNMLPIPPLDGSKVLGWSMKNWAYLFIASVILLILSVYI